MYVYYLTRGFSASTCAFNLPTRAFNLATRAFSPLTRGFELVTRGFELATREFELVTRNTCFTFPYYTTRTQLHSIGRGNKKNKVKNTTETNGKTTKNSHLIA